MATTFVSFFRAINVGGNNKVSMAALKELHEALGLRNVVTYLQTGNVVFDSDAILEAEQLEKELARVFQEKFGFRSEVFVRSAAELATLPTKNAFLNDQPNNQSEKETKWIMVLLLSGCPTPEAVAALREAYNGSEEFLVDGKEFFAYYPEGVGRSKLTNALIERKLKVSTTGRNWNTIAKMIELSQNR